MNILIFKHIANEPAGHAEQWASDRGHTFTYHYWNSRNVLTTLPDFDLLIIMGGMMGAYDDNSYPWLVQEKALIREAIENNRRVLGICLGAQLIASAMGAGVYKNTHTEIGFHPVNTIDTGYQWFAKTDSPLRMFQWHGDTFELPEGACLIATSENVKNQAFSIGNNVVALQFHPEMNADSIEGLLNEAFRDEGPSPWKQCPEMIRKNMYIANDGKQLLFNLLDKITHNV